MDRVHVHIESGSNCWFTSDLHIGHSNVMRFSNRPWTDVKVMNTELINLWNETVNDNDVVFVVGDFCWTKDWSEKNKIIKLLNGSVIFFVPGNHDNVELYKKVKDKRLRILSDNVILYVSGIDEDKPTREHEFMVSHCPLATWPHFYRGVLNLHGHIHSGPRSKSEIDRPGFDLKLKPHLTYDVGVDNNEYKPVEIREILKKVNEYE